MACDEPVRPVGSAVVPHIAVPEGKADPEVRVWALRPEMGMGAGALSHAIYDESIVPVRERELARMRIAQINGCVICQQWRSTPGAEGAVTEDDYAHVLEWRAHDGYSERERLAIDYAERFALDHHSIDGDFYARCAPRASPTPRSSTSPSASEAGWRSAARCTCSASTTPARSRRNHPRPTGSAVEDRITPGLYLEMTDQPVDDVRARARARGARAGRASSGRRGGATSKRDRDDLPARASRVRPPRACTRSTTRSARRPCPPASPAITSGTTAGRARASSPGARRSGCRSC